MSHAEIADNKWEVSSTKPPIGMAGVAQLALFLGFCALFAWIATMSVVALVTPKQDSNSLEQQYRNMNKPGQAPES